VVKTAGAAPLPFCRSAFSPCAPHRDVLAPSRRRGQTIPYVRNHLAGLAGASSCRRPSAPDPSKPRPCSPRAAPHRGSAAPIVGPAADAHTMPGPYARFPAAVFRRTPSTWALGHRPGRRDPSCLRPVRFTKKAAGPSLASISARGNTPSFDPWVEVGPPTACPHPWRYRHRLHAGWRTCLPRPPPWTELTPGPPTPRPRGWLRVGRPLSASSSGKLAPEARQKLAPPGSPKAKYSSSP